MADARPAGVWAFFSSVLWNVWTFILYGGGAAILAVWGYWTSESPPLWAWVTVILLGFLTGAYRAWKAERLFGNRVAQELAEAIAVRPRLSGYISSVEVQSGDRNRLYVYVTVRNKGSPSAVDRWQLRLKLKDKGYGVAESALSRGQFGSHGDTGNLVGDNTVVASGGKHSGWLLYESPESLLGFNVNDVFVEFWDTHGNQSTASVLSR